MKIPARLFAAVACMAALSACDAKLNVNVKPPVPSNRPNVPPSANPSARPDDMASVPPSANPSQNPTPVASASASGTGSLTITGQDLFNKYTINYHQGQKWVYRMTQPGTSTSIPMPTLPPGTSLPPGFNFPSSTSSGSTDLGELVWEVVKVEGDQVTMKTTTTVNTPVGAQTTTKTTTSARSDFASQVTQSAATGTEGTVTYTFGASGESVSVPAGSYTADRIDGVFKIKATSGGASGTSDTMVKLWITNGTGLVKYEAKSTTNASGVTVDTTTLFELKSYSG